MSFYVVLVNMPTFAYKNLGLPLDQVLMVQMFAVALMTVVIPLSGLLSDRLGRRPVRSTGVSVAYKVVVMVFGGFAPLIVTWLSKVLGTPVVPSFYVLFACVLTLLGTYCMQQAPRTKKPLPFSSEVKP